MHQTEGYIDETMIEYIARASNAACLNENNDPQTLYIWN